MDNLNKCRNVLFLLSCSLIFQTLFADLHMYMLKVLAVVNESNKRAANSARKMQWEFGCTKLMEMNF